MRKSFKTRLGTFLIIFSTLLLFSCATKPTEKEKAWSYVQTHPTEFAQWCIERFPNVITRVVPGKKEIVHDSVLVPGEIIPCPPPSADNPIPSVKVPDKYIPTTSEKCTSDTIFQTDTRDLKLANDKLRKAEQDIEYWKNQALDFQDKNIELRDEYKVLVDENAELKTSKNTAWWITGLLSSLILLFFIYRIFIKK